MKNVLIFRGHLLITLFFLLSIASNSQTIKIDSLKKVLFSAKDKDKSDLLNNISKEYWYQNSDSSVYYAKLALALAQNQNYKRAEAEAYRNLGMANLYKDTIYPREFFYKALHIFLSLADKKGIADTYNNLGTMWAEKNNNRALICYDSALLIFRSIGDKKGEGAVLNYINMTYKMMGDFQKAIDYALQGLEVRKSTN